LGCAFIIRIRCFCYSLGSENFKRAPGSFLFSLVNPSGLPTKIPLRARQKGNAIYCGSGYGPTFGGGHDLHIPCSPNFNNCSVSLNNTYQCPTGKNACTFLTGNGSFLVNEMETFGFEKQETYTL